MGNMLPYTCNELNNLLKEFIHYIFNEEEICLVYGNLKKIADKNLTYLSGRS